MVAPEAVGEQVGARFPAGEEAIVVLLGGPVALGRVGLVERAVPVPPGGHVDAVGPIAKGADGEGVVEVGVAVVAVAGVPRDPGGPRPRPGPPGAPDGA